MTQHFAGSSWRTSPELASRMFEAYRTYRALHELLAFLDLAIRRMPSHDALELRALYQRIDDLCEASVIAVDITTLRRQVLDHLQVLVAAGQDTARQHFPPARL